jgi:hypothetical protein
LRDAGPTPAAGAAGALLGARDGAAAIPERFLTGESSPRWAALADRLTRVVTAAARPD